MILECQMCRGQWDANELTAKVTPYRTIGECPNCGGTVFLGIISDETPKDGDEIRGKVARMETPTNKESLRKQIERRQTDGYQPEPSEREGKHPPSGGTQVKPPGETAHAKQVESSRERWKKVRQQFSEGREPTTMFVAEILSEWEAVIFPLSAPRPTREKKPTTDYSIEDRMEAECPHEHIGRMVTILCEQCGKVFDNDPNERTPPPRAEGERMRNLLEDVVNELDLSGSVIEEHGPMGTEPAKLVRLVLDQKDMQIRALKAGMIDAAPTALSPQAQSEKEEG